jgi:hypothetical protein
LYVEIYYFETLVSAIVDVCILHQVVGREYFDLRRLSSQSQVSTNPRYDGREDVAHIKSG